MKKYVAGLMILGMLGGAAFLAGQQKPAPAPAAKAKPAQAAPGQRGQMPLERLKTALGLTDEQAAKLQESRKAGQESQQAFREQMQKLRGELAPLLRDPKADAGKVNGLIDQMAKLGADRAKKGFQDRDVLAKILTPEQLTKLQNLRGRGMGMGMGMEMGMRGGPGQMGRGRMMGPRGGMMTGPGMGMRMGMGRGMGQAGRFGMGFGPGRGRLPQRGFRGWRWIR